MRNPEEERKDAVYASFADCGLSEQQIEMATRYVNGEIPSCDLGITQKQEFTRGQGMQQRDDNIQKIADRLERHKQYEMAGHYIEIMYQIFGTSMYSIYYQVMQARKFVPVKTRVALEVTLAARHHSVGYASYRAILQITTDREILRAAMEDTDKSAGGPDFIILTAMFYDGPENKRWDGKPVWAARQTQENRPAEKGVLGFLGGLLGLSTGSATTSAPAANIGSCMETNAYVKQYPQEFKRYEEMFPEILEKLFYAGIPAPVKTAMQNFLRERDIRKPIPTDILNFTANAAKGLLPRESGLFMSYAAVNYRLSPVIFNFLRIFLSGDLTPKGLQYMYYTEPKKPMEQEVRRWRVDFQVNDVTYIIWLGSKWAHQNSNLQLDKTIAGKILADMTRENPDAYVQAIRQADDDVRQCLIDAAKHSGNNAFIQSQLLPIISSDQSVIQQKIMDQLIPTGDPVMKADIMFYLKGEKNIDVVLPWESKVVGVGNSYQNLSGPVINYGATYGKDAFYDRCIAFIAFRQMEYSILPFCGEFSYDFKIDRFKTVLGSLERGRLPVLHRLRICSLIYDSYRGKKEEKWKAMDQYFSKILQERRAETVDAFQNGPVSGRLLGIEILGRNALNNKAELLSFVSESSKQVKEKLIQVYGAHPEWTEDFLQILKTSKKGSEREVAAAVLAKYPGIMDHQEELNAVIEQEKSKKVIDLVREILRAGGAPGMEADDTETEGGEGASAGLTADGFIKECHKGGKKRGLAWIYDQPMPEVHFLVKEAQAEAADAENDEAKAAAGAENAEGAQAASEEYMQAVLLAYASMPIPGVNKDVHILTDGLNKAELANYMEVVYEKFLQQGAEAKKKWVLYATSIHGGVRMVAKLQHQIGEWAENSRGAIASEAVKALALNDTPTALLIVDGMARKYKFKQVRKAAQDAMAFAAQQLGLTVEELADRIVPDLGFDERMERHFDYGTRSFTVRISPDLDIEVKDESGKKLKSLPAVGKSDDEEKASAALEEFKELKKQMKTTVKTQAIRLELAMSLDRKWTAENWKKLFVKNPLMHQFAISLIWGNYKDGKLAETFRYLEDGTFNTACEEEYELPEDALIGLVHPIELEKETIDAWKEQLSDYEITQVVEQLDRPVFTLTEEEKGRKTLERFGGKIINGLSISGKMTGHGWSKGAAQDAGVYYSYYRKDADAGYAVELHFSGSYIGDESEDVTVYDAAFYAIEDADKCVGNSYGNIPKGDKERKLGTIPARYMSEILYQLTKATASSTETDEEWRKDR